MAKRIANWTPKASAPSAFNFVLSLRVVNLFADMTYEGGASIMGPFSW